MCPYSLWYVSLVSFFFFLVITIVFPQELLVILFLRQRFLG